ncbi:MAG: deoxyhypusine synthase [Acidilobaceae archaeon]
MNEFELVKDVKVELNATSCELFKVYSSIHGFSAADLSRALNVLERGLRESNVKALAFTGNLVASGLRGILAQLVASKAFNVVITTTGALDHDIAKSEGARYFKGFFEVDDAELKKRGLYRLGNIFIPSEDYGPLVEKFVRRLVEKAVEIKREWALFELLKLAGETIKDENSILRSAYEAGTEVFVPGWPDGAFGTALFVEWSRRRGDFIINYFKDMERLAEIFFTRRGKTCALILGGGISKHHVLWWAQFRGGLDYVVYITTAIEYDGSLSGARPREAVSWGKVKDKGEKVVVYGDATIVLPLLASCLFFKLSSPQDLDQSDINAQSSRR